MTTLLALLCFLQSETFEDFTQKLDVTVSVDMISGRHELAGAGHRVAFAPGMQVVIVDGSSRSLAAPVAISSGRLALPEDLKSILRDLFGHQVEQKPAVSHVKASKSVVRVARDFEIVLDAGHGGIHTGCWSVNHRLVEKDVSLDVVKRLTKLLEQAGVRVTLTRNADTEFSKNVHEDLRERVEITNRANPDAFLSVHLNTAGNRTARGFEIFVPRDGSHHASCDRLAHCVQSEFGKNLSTPDRGIKEAGFVVIKGPRCPAVLVEVEFLSNPQGETDMLDPSYRQRVAQALCDAVLRYAASQGR